MRKLLLLLSVVLLPSCLGGYSKLTLGSVQDIGVESVSLFSSRFTASAIVVNKSSRELLINGVEIYLEKVDGISLSIDDPLVVPCGSSKIDISATLSYSPVSLIELMGSFEHGNFPLKVVLKLPGGNIRLKKTVKSAELVKFINSVRK